MKRCARSLPGSRKTRKSSSQTHTFSKVLCTVTLHRKYTRALPLESTPPPHTHTHYMVGERCVPRAEVSRVGEMESPWIAQYVGLSAKVNTEEAK